MSDETKKSKGEKAELTTEDTIKAAVKAAVAESVAVGMAVAREGASKGRQLLADSKSQCPECRQYRSACKGKHKQVIVYPQNPRLVRPGWVGVKLNGVTYRSNDSKHKITVPAKSPVMSLLRAWEKAEEKMSISNDFRRNIGNMSPLPGRTRIARF